MMFKQSQVKPALATIAMLLLGGTLSVNTATAADCQPVTVTQLKAANATFHYRTNGQSYMRIYVNGTVKNASRMTYQGNSSGNKASTVHLLAQDGRGKYYALGTSNVTTYLRPYDGRTGISADRPLDIPAVNSNDFRVSLKANVTNHGCPAGRQRIVNSEFIWDLSAVRNGGRAKMVGRPKISYIGPPKPRGSTGAPRPRS